MAVRRVKFRRGNTAENNAFTGEVGEITIDTTTSSIRVQDGTAGGVDTLRADMSNNATIATNINFTNADRTIGGAMTTTNNGNTSTVLTLGGAGSTVTIAGDLTVTGTTTNTSTLAVAARVIEIAEGANAGGDNDHDIGVFFTRSNGQNRGLFFFLNVDADLLFNIKVE